tara:strand:+ start:608 stop:1033 length:426 start_codon:yes stop_codon:yes gene_type:complete
MSSINHSSPNFNWCPYAEYKPSKSENLQGNYSTVKVGQVTPELRNRNENDSMPPPPPHGGLFRGPVLGKPWEAIPVTPTMTNYIQNNLRSANPPPGATEQYIGGDRLGNNYAPMPGTYWFNPVDRIGQFQIKSTNKPPSNQ